MISTVNTVFARAAQIHPDNVVVRTLRGKALLMCGQYEAALEVGSETKGVMSLVEEAHFCFLNIVQTIA